MFNLYRKWLYAVGVEGGLNEELFLVAELGNGSGDGASVHLGLRDELAVWRWP